MLNEISSEQGGTKWGTVDRPFIICTLIKGKDERIFTT